MQHHDPKANCQRLLAWNRLHLTAASALDEAAIGEIFAPHFTVKANGRTYAADHRNYREFLDDFRRTISEIDYQVQEILAEGERAVLAMTACVTRLDGAQERYEAMLLLAFDDSGRVALWHEVYVRA